MGPLPRSRTDRSDPCGSRAGLLGLVDQHDGDRDPAFVADRIDVPALADARDDLLLLPVLDLATAVRADQDVEQLLVERHVYSSPRSGGALATASPSIRLMASYPPELPRMTFKTSAVFSA